MASSFVRRHPVVTGLLVLVGFVLIGGGIAYFSTDRGKELLPTLEQPTLNISNITREKIKGNMVVQMRNHAPITLRIDSLHYTTRVDGKQLAQGHKSQPLVLHKNATSRLELPLELNLPQLTRKAQEAQRDCVTVQMHTVLYATLPVAGPQQFPVDVRKRVYIPKLPKIEVADVKITKLGLQEGKAQVYLRVTNYESIPFTIKQVSYHFQVEDDLDVQGQETQNVTFKKKGTELMPILVRFEPKSMPKVLFKSIFKAGKTNYRLTGTATVAAGQASARDATMKFNSQGTVKELKELAKGKKSD
ncbi:LEA type 2 family protein [Hymenobacter aerilatus]|uniref:LEA type 2 family protein n=1 Tax=Hymenobacter aerilatus TaxID=2932251 RepID=A0A8T9T6B4_9BACT|nr:LEA type 2 family protein [Hymenobacter aerilatus]UOR07369.1 LEA type 2 family protein [Hymenobacter aerilatus]